MTVERKHTNERMSQIVIHGDTVYLAGQVAVDAWVPEGNAPARACVEAKLAFTKFTVEVGVIAAR